jgi:hypothetical protein
MFKLLHVWMIFSFGSFFWVNLTTKPVLLLMGTELNVINQVAVAAMCYMLISAWWMASDLRNFEVKDMAPFTAYLKAGLMAPVYLPLLRHSLRG